MKIKYQYKELKGQKIKDIKNINAVRELKRIIDRNQKKSKFIKAWRVDNLINIKKEEWNKSKESTRKE